MLSASELSDVEMMRNPRTWPLKQVLPLVRSTAPGNTLECGFISVNSAGEVQPVIYLADVFTVTASDAVAGDLPQRAYESLDDITADGWRVD